MSKKLKLKTKIISLSVIALFTMQLLSPLVASAITLPLNYDNPNKSGNNPYKFTSQNILDSNLIMKVVGCTGIVNKISTAIHSVFKDLLPTATPENKAETGKIEAVTVSNPTQDKKLDESKKIEQENQTREECLNGIAVTLAKNQLTSMTKYTMNWIATGFNGDPMYVRDVNMFMSNISEGIVMGEVKALGDIKQYPYSLDFFRSYIRTYKNKSTGYYGSQSSMQNYLKESKTIADFAKDWSVGGWDAYLALTQYPQNNPLGYTMTTSQDIADKQAAAIQNTKDELAQSGGIFNQKKCSQWNEVDPKTGEYIMETITNENREYREIKTTYDSKNPATDECIKWETVTPGSIIKDKVSTYINSPERQLEIADTINESLNSLFSALITKFQTQGLTSLASNRTDFGSMNLGGYGSNSLTDLLGNSGDNTSTGYSNTPFDLVRDLGNKYITGIDPVKNCATEWNAKDNIVLPITNPIKRLSRGYGTTNECYKVSVTGSADLFDGNEGWYIGDRVFFDGVKWQNWKCGPITVGLDGKNKCTVQKNPIKEKGVIQIQQDYIVAANKGLASLEPVMPALGELDYCIPGPNPNWRANSEDAEQAYLNFMDGITIKSTVDSLPAWLTKGMDIADSFFSAITGGITDKIKAAIGNGGLYLSPPLKDGSLYNAYKGIFEGTNLWDTEIVNNPFTFIRADIPSIFNTIFTTESKARDNLNNRLDNAAVFIDQIYSEYHNKIRAIYGNSSSMQTEFIDTEKETFDNANYLPMATTGLNITKNIVSYNDSVITSTKEYKDGIVTANSNIYKLKQIQAEVGKIVKVAQDRRDLKIKDALGPNATIPLECLDLENIEYIDLSDWAHTQTETGRCSDGIDNDGNGLIDMEDPACNGVVDPKGCPPEVLGYYKIYNCQTGEYSSQAGPLTSGGCSKINISQGDRLQGGSGNYYYVTSGISTTPYAGLSVLPYATLETSYSGNLKGCLDGSYQPPVVNTTKYKVTVKTTGQGSASPSSQTVVEGGTTTFRVMPNVLSKVENYTGSDCGGNESTPQPGIIIYTTGPMYKDCTVTVNFTP